MICHKHRCIFVEVPKTGSTSVRAVVGTPSKPHQNIWQIRYELEHSWTHYGGFANRLFASLYLLLPAGRREAAGKRVFESYFKFGFVRNPWDRAVSLYERAEGLSLRDRMTFSEFVEWMKFSSSTCIHPVPHRHQLDWFVDPHGNVVVDFIGNFETLEEDWEFICQRTGIRESLPHLNQNPRREKHYTEYYTPRTRGLIAERFRVDIEYFGYEFDRPPVRSSKVGARTPADVLAV
jgi:hypothetical protein